MAIPTENKHEVIAKLDEGLEIWHVHIDALKEQDKNARYMKKQQFDRLTQNIKQGKRLESLPFCCWNLNAERIEVISGHHRVRAARTANIQMIFILIDVNGMDRSEVVSKQLSHNALSGEDDMQIVKELFEEIESLDLQYASGLDPNQLGMYTTLEEAKIDNINFKYDYQCMQLIFLPTNLQKVKETFDYVETELNCVASIEDFSDFIETMRLTSVKENIRNASSIVVKMCDIVKKYFDEQEKVSESSEEKSGDHASQEKSKAKKPAKTGKKPAQ